MKLAEALALRAETTRRIEQLRSRIVDSARTCTMQPSTSHR